MARRNPMNERYRKETAPAGKTRRSAASAKPKRAGADLSSKPKKQASTKAKTRTPLVINPPTEEFRRWRKIWWSLLGGATLLTVASFFMRSLLKLDVAAKIILGLGYGGIFGAIYIDWTKLRRLRQEWMSAQKSGGSAKQASSRKTIDTAKDDD